MTLARSATVTIRSALLLALMASKTRERASSGCPRVTSASSASIGSSLLSQDGMASAGLMKPTGPRKVSTVRPQHSRMVAWRVATGLCGFTVVKAETSCGAVMVARRCEASSSGKVRYNLDGDGGGMGEPEITAAVTASDLSAFLSVNYFSFSVRERSYTC
jgi:hypothetical protein